MAKKEVTVKTCDRHATVITDGVETVTFAVGSDQYAMDLCAQHRLQFDREISAWVRIAREVEPSSNLGGKLEITRTRELESPIRPSAPSSFLPQEPTPGDKRVYVQKLPPGYKLWSLSKHAKERLQERGVTERDVLITAADPGYAFPSEQDPDEWFHVRRDISVVVNRDEHVVITVLPHGWKAENPKEKEQAHG